MVTQSTHFNCIELRYPHIAVKIAKYWGTKELSPFLNELMTDTRGGTRQGFPPDVAVSLFRLLNLHDQEFPEHILQVVDIWSVSNYEENKGVEAFDRVVQLR